MAPDSASRAADQGERHRFAQRRPVPQGAGYIYEARLRGLDAGAQAAQAALAHGSRRKTRLPTRRITRALSTQNSRIENHHYG